MIILVVAAILIVVIGYWVGRSKPAPRSGSRSGSADSSAGDGGSSIVYMAGSSGDSDSPHHGHHWGDGGHHGDGGGGHGGDGGGGGGGDGGGGGGDGGGSH
jgi:hypothetical protein